MTVITERVRGYRLLERAGQDGPWAVHLARPAAAGADVLVRTLACHRVDRRALKRIVRGFGFPEALAAHAGVIPVLEVGATGDGRPYLVTPVHEGLTLAERPGRSLPMPPAQAAGLLRSVAGALAATHAVGGVHGRVKQENVIVTPGGVALTGFAMSALMSIVELPDGTVPSVHASPEELEGRAPSPASDVYALGSMVYELLAGRPAFPLDGPASTAKFTLGVLTESPAPLPAGVPRELADLLAKAMSKDPAARPAATDLAAFTVGATGRAPASAPAPGPPPAPAGGAGAPLSGGPSGPGLDLPLPRRPADRPYAVAADGEEAPERFERSAPRELVWTVDHDRSQVRPPAGPQPFLPPPPDVPSEEAPPQEQPAGRRAPLFVAGASALAVLVGVGSVALAMSGGSGTEVQQRQRVAATAPGDPDPVTPPRADRQPSAVPQTSHPDAQPGRTSQPEESRARSRPATSPPADRPVTDPKDAARYRPKSLKVVADNGTTVTLAWRAVRKSGYPTVVQQAPGDRLMSATGDAGTYTVGGLDPATGYCFKVGAVVALGQPSSVAWSPALCIRGATEADPRGHDDETQPPIVLPPATPPPS
ncbi:protein kinase domain-containing protein [Nonomuraea sp. KM88]|uniref:protein kinase domain-containing protein n=1 Tax=Nonomuraea sp. KM88 TaxID=3457427 RepID=UPI003FCC6216